MEETVIDDDNFSKFLPGGERVGGAFGCIPRDESVTPMRAVTMPLIPRSEWSARIKEKAETKSRLSDLRMMADNGQMIKCLNQGNYGYCWSHSVTMALMMRRAFHGLPFVPLSAFAVAATIKNGANEGAWGALALDFAVRRGIPSQAMWPQGNANPATGTAVVWEDAAKHKVDEAWVDVAVPAWDAELSFDQVATCLLSNEPVILDYNWWGHSVCGLDLVEVSPDNFGVRIINSWGDGWEDRGMAVLAGSKAIPNGASAISVATAS